MITVAGRPLDAAFGNDYPEGSVERELITRMSESEDSFRYDSLDQLKFELTLRREVVRAARDLHRSRIAFADFHKSKANEDFWDRKENGGFMLRDGARPSEAIEDIFRHGRQYAMECATAMMVVFYKALLEVFGADNFDRLFPRIYLMDWDISDRRLRGIGMPKRTDVLLLGDRGYFRNPDVNPKTPEWQGENVIVLPDSLYYGHGIGIADADDMIKALNSNRIAGAERSAYLLDMAGRPDYRQLASLYSDMASQPALGALSPAAALV